MNRWLGKPHFLLIGVHASKRGHYFYRLIWLGCISASVPVLLAGIVYYYFSLANLSKQMESENGSSLAIIENRIERMLQAIERDSLQLADEPIVKDTFTMGSFETMRLYHSQLLDYLIRQKNSRDYVESIYYYNMSADVLITTDLGYVIPPKPISRSKLLGIDKVEQSQWLFLPEAEKRGLFSFARLIPSASNQSYAGILLFQIKKSTVREHLFDYSLLLERYVYILDQQNRILFNSGNQPAANEENMMREIQALGPGNGTVQDAHGNNVLYGYVKSDLGRTYISLVPEKSLTQRMWWIRWVSIFTVLFFLAIGLVLSLITSRRAYNPLENLMKYGSTVSPVGQFDKNMNEFAYIMDCLNQLTVKTQALSNLVKNMEPTSRERFLQKLLTRDYINKKTLREECETYKIPLYGDYWVIVIDFDQDFKNTRYIPEDKPIISFALSNILEELVRSCPKLKGIGTNDYYGRKVVIVQTDGLGSEEYGFEELLSLARNIYESAGTYLSLQVTIGIGRKYHHIEDISVSYKEALSALQYRMFKANQPILHIDQLETADKLEKFVYPTETEASIFQALHDGDGSKAEQTMVQFTQHIQSFQSYQLMYQAYSMLLSSILHRMETFGELPMDVVEMNSFEMLSGFRSSEEINQWFATKWFPLYLSTRNQYLFSYNQSFIQNICRFVIDHIYSDISLIICAEHVHMNPSYISRVFKREMGVSFVEYVMESKVNEACKLLLDTDKSIVEIASLLGYTERNLNRLFQKFKHMPPGQYRNQHR